MNETQTDIMPMMPKIITENILPVLQCCLGIGLTEVRIVEILNDFRCNIS